ncbi:hypothetical protein MIR68_002600 [Amoeboaphelidium protococcarum]|nr:hypothetical protein MIR68_002600 [Amoeboaphelidium protococcarum]
MNFGRLYQLGRRRFSNVICTSHKAPLPLSGIRVLDLTRVLAGPFCTQLLGDLGAEVIKVERPIIGDDTRSWTPPSTDQDGFESPQTAYFLAVNRNKTSITVDIRSKEGADIIRQLAAVSDVLVENYLPGKLAEYGLGFEQIHQTVNSRLIYASISGYGQTGPYASRPGYDVIIEAEGGLMHVTGEADGDPVKVGVAITDISTGLYAHGAIMAALLMRQKTDKGQHIDVNLFETQLATMANIASNYLIAGDKGSRYGTAHASIVPYQAFKTADSGIVVAAVNDTQFKKLVTLLELSKVLDQSKFKTNADRVKHREELVSIMAQRFRSQSTHYWMKLLEGSGLVHGPINDVQQAFEHAQTKARGIVKKVHHPSYGDVKVVGSPVRFSDFDCEVSRAPPVLGQDTEDILRNLLHYDDAKIQKLKQQKVI